MPVWNQFVEILRESIVAYAQACNGNVGAGILAVTFLVRLALLPLAIRMGRAAAAHQQALARIQPQLDALRTRYRQDPARLADETRRVMSREGIAPGLAFGPGSLAQMTVLVALYSAARQAAARGGRFLWIRSLAEPDWLLAVAATLITVVATATGVTDSTPGRTMLLLSLSALVTLVALSKMAAGVGLYWGLSSLFGVAQGWAVRRSRTDGR